MAKLQQSGMSVDQIITLLKKLGDGEKKEQDEFDSDLKRAGADGWELVAITQRSIPFLEKTGMIITEEDFYLKRPSN